MSVRLARWQSLRAEVEQSLVSQLVLLGGREPSVRRFWPLPARFGGLEEGSMRLQAACCERGRVHGRTWH